jgi:hypothetical protein
MTESSPFGAIADEFEGADFGDVRLESRLQVIAESLIEAPAATIPAASKSVAGREAAYRFIENRNVTIDRIMAAHQSRTVERCAQAGKVYVVSDTTTFEFEGEVRGEALGRLHGNARGFLGHFALAISADQWRTPLGVLGIQTIVRDDKRKRHKNNYQQKKDGNRESLRWGELARAADDQLRGVTAIHVMDSEADIYELLTDMTAGGHRFVIRSGQNRAVIDEGKLFDAVADEPVLLEREVHLSARRRSPDKPPKAKRLALRESRTAQLAISSRSVALRRPQTTDSSYPKSLDVNVVHVFEPSPPDGEDPVRWLLLTSEPIQSADEVAKVVDAYRARWTIEEYFKALKTGCAYEARQLRSIRTLTNALGIFAVIAWRLLLLRAVERAAPQTPATTVLEPIMLEALAARLKNIRERRLLPAQPTVADLMWGIGRLGGMCKSNGAPGWQVLWRGFQDLLTWGAGYSAGRASVFSDHS